MDVAVHPSQVTALIRAPPALKSRRGNALPIPVPMQQANRGRWETIPTMLCISTVSLNSKIRCYQEAALTFLHHLSQTVLNNLALKCLLNKAQKCVILNAPSLQCQACSSLASSCSMMMTPLKLQVSFTYPYLLALGDWEGCLDT